MSPTREAEVRPRVSTRAGLLVLAALLVAGAAACALATVGADYSAAVVLIFTVAALWEGWHARVHGAISGLGLLLGWFVAGLLGLAVLAE